MNLPQKTQLIFVVDPLCSWCWGFHPVIETLRRDYACTYDFKLVVGGLRTKGAMVWSEETKTKLQQTWQQVADTTGQQFTDNLLQLDTFDYDTYPACKALVTVRELWGEDEAFAYLKALHQAFYIDGLNMTKVDTLLSLVDEEKRAQCLTFYESERAEVMMRHDFAKARSMGATVFPSVVTVDGEGHLVCRKGYQQVEDIIDF